MWADRLSAWVTRRRGLVLALAGALTVAGVAALPRLRLDLRPEAVLRGSGDDQRNLQALQATFGRDDRIVSIIVEAPAGRSVLDPGALNYQARLAAALGDVDPVAGVDSLATLEEPVLLSAPPRTRRLLPAGASDDQARAAAEAIRRIPMLTPSLYSRDESAAALAVTLNADVDELAEVRAAVAEIEAALAEAPPPEGYRVSMTGLPVIRADIVARLGAGLMRLGPVMGVVFFVTLWICYRRLGYAILPLAAVGAGLAWTFGLLAISGQSLDVVSNALPFLLAAIGVANCVHVIGRYVEHLRYGLDPRVAAEQTVRRMGWACLLTFGTTAVGFASLLATRSDSLNGFGLHAMIGLGWLYLASVGLLGAMLPWLGTPGTDNAGPRRDWIGRVLAAGGYAVARRPWPVVAGAAAVLVGAVLLATRAEVNSRTMETYEPDHPAARPAAVLDEKLGGLLTLDLHLVADDPNELLRPEVMARVARFAEFAAAQPEVLSCQSYVDLHRAVEGRLGNSQPAAAAQLLRRYDSATRYSRFVSADGTQARVMLRIGDIGTARGAKLIERLQRKAGELFPDRPALRARLTGYGVLTTLAMGRFVRDLLLSLCGASLVVFAMIAGVFRSLRVGLISIAPNVAPLVVTWGWMGLRGYDLNAANVIVFAISIGIAVDNTIHFLARFREEIVRSHRLPTAIYRAYRGAGRAIVMTTLLIVLGLSVLGLSEFMPSRRFAELTSVAMVAALAGDLLLLPACLALFWRSARGVRASGADAEAAPPRR